MIPFTQAFILLCGLYLSDADSSIHPNPSSYGQSDIQAPAYVPPYLTRQQFTKTGYRGTKPYGGTKTAYSGTKTAYGGTKTAYGGTKTAYGGTQNAYGAHPTRYSESKTWYTNNNKAPTYEVFQNNAYGPYQPKCVPECQNSGICMDTNTCVCPQNYQGKYCEFKKKLCLDYPKPKNSMIRCGSDMCTVTCLEGFKFIDGSTAANMNCANGQWVPVRADFTTIPDCLPQCEPRCMNGGVCLALNTCSCPTAYRGPQCQYPVSACDANKLAFHGSMACEGDGEKYKCQLDCPPRSRWSSAPAEYYTCFYSSGQFQPQPIPHCIYESEEYIIIPSPPENRTYYSLTNSPTEKNLYQDHVHTVDVVIRDVTPKGGTCLTWAGAHYKTFDGKVYSFQSPCQHILLRDAQDHKYTVAIQQKACKRRSYCPSELTVYLEEKAYVLATGEDGSVIFRNTKRMIPIPATLPGIRVSMPGDYVIVNLDSAGVAIKWDTNTLVQIEGSILLWNNTEGLCGTLDGNPTNELTAKNGHVVNSVTMLASSWQINKMGDICETNPVETSACASGAAEDVASAARFCKEMISMKKFRKCSKVMDVLQFIETCKWDYCACASTFNSEDCACRAVSVYAKECLRHGVEEMKNWRDPDTCPMKCPDGKLYNSCGPDSQPSCAFPLTSAKTDNSSCVEGCFCPAGLLLEAGKCVPKQECPCRLRNKSFQPGSVINKECNTCTCQAGEWICTEAACGARCRAVGDPHYTTFDGLRYDFMGRCTYTMLQAENVTVQVENVACSGSISEEMNLTPLKTAGKPSCTKAVTVNYGGTSIHLSQGGVVTVNGKEVTSLPVMAGDVKIRAASSLFLIVQLPNKVDLWWDGNTRVFIDVPSKFRDKTKGLCGTFNLNQKDDFLTPEYDVEQSITAFANKWRTRELCDESSAPEPEHPCKANVENKEKAEEYCSKLKSAIFEACHWHVDVEPYYESCLYDMCACEGDVSRCLCPVLGDYAMSCARAGVMLQWRYNVHECELPCSGGQVYTVCADSCLRKCTDSAFSSSCTPTCVEGCACPTGELLDDNGVCVPTGLCPCIHKGLQFHAGYKEVRAGKVKELCTCVGARWDCTPATPEDVKLYPPAEDLRSNCTAINNMDFTSCAAREPLTCKNMHLSPTPTTSECHPGCQCKRGFVLDVSSKQCIHPAQCPCHHGGQSYPDGHVMKEECNTCECKRGNWTCTKQQCAGLCSAWGDSHITTFDGTDYEFEGVCTYLLAKANIDSNDGFDVEIQNVPCGTTGATCSKSLTLKVGSGAKEEIVSLTKNAPLPDISQLKRIKLRLAGAYVFLDVASLGVSVQWDRQMRVYVKVDPMWHGRVKGLCGNFNGDMRDDFQTPSGGGLAESSALIFADSWKLKPSCPKAQEVPDHCKQRPERKAWASATCGALQRAPFSLCHAEVPWAAWAARCERDACACDAGGDCGCACAALAAYALACAHRGVHIHWRTQDLCPMQCDDECSTYDGCVSPCPLETCDNTLQYEDIKATCEQDTCVEGCKPKKPCAEGLVYKNSSTTECVPRARCKPACMKLDNGTEIAEGELVSEDDCHSCRCSKNHVVCTGQPCSTTMSEATVTEDIYRSTMTLVEPFGTTVPEEFYGSTPLVEEYSTEAVKESYGTKVPTGSETTEVPYGTKTTEQIYGITSPVEEYGTKVPTGSETTEVPYGTTIEEEWYNTETVKDYYGTRAPEGPHGTKVPTGSETTEVPYGTTIEEEWYNTETVKDYYGTRAPEGPHGTKVPTGSETTELPYGTTIEEEWYNTETVKDYYGTRAPEGPHGTMVPDEPYDKAATCISGWTPWINRNVPVFDSKLGITREVEPLPELDELPLGSPRCLRAKMTDVDCQLGHERRRANETGMNVECSLARGFVCEGNIMCPDFEIRVLCTCDEPNPCENITSPNTKHPTDCAKFYECSPSGSVLKSCGPGTLYNPKTFVCDWPASVALVRPECLTPVSTPASTTNIEQRTTQICPPGQVYRPCAYPCDKMCDYFKKTHMEKNRCINETCVGACVSESLMCEYGSSHWRDFKTCVPKRDCTCMSDGKIVRPGAVIVDGCLKCQCLDNDIHCDTTKCVSLNVPKQGSTHESYIMRTAPITTTVRLNYSTIKSTTKIPSTTSLPHSTTTTSTPAPIDEGRSLLQPTKIATDLTTVATPLIIVKSTATPPPECSPDNYLDLMWGDQPLPDSAFTASSTLDNLHQPQFAVLNGRPLDSLTDGSWIPAVNDQNQFLEVSLPRREPVFGVLLQGSPVQDQYVTSYKVLYGDDGQAFSVVSTPDGNPKVFRGPVDHNEISKQMLSPPIEAKHVRLQPLTWHNTIAVRMELIGCSLSETTLPSTDLSTTPEPLLCDDPLGFAADLPLDSITTSSNPEDKQFLALDGERGWRPLYSTPGEWIMFNFTSPRNITGIQTRGGDNGCVTAYKVLHSTDLEIFSPILDKNGEERVFPANYDKTSVMEHDFRPPIRAQYLKIMPLKWMDNIEIRVEPIGCFELYPSVPPPAPTAAPPSLPAGCQVCPGVRVVTCACADDLYYDGEACVPREQCPCVASFMTYPVGATFMGANCDTCVCKLGGVTDCSPHKKCNCDEVSIFSTDFPYREVSELVSRVDPATCACACVPCPPHSRKCSDGACLAADRWCDGISDCSDDELRCSNETTLTTAKAVTVAVTPPTTAVTTVKPPECPPVQCPPGYQVVFSSRRPSTISDIPPLRPRYSYSRYINRKGGYTGSSGGFSKGGFSKGGFSKGGSNRGFVPPLPPQHNQAFNLAKPSLSPTPAATEDICPQFKCIPKVPPFPKPGFTAAPPICLVPSCPSGYTMKLDTSAHGSNDKCPQYECVPPPERPVYCNVTGRTFNTFDGTEYKYDVCFHILARDNRFESWTVLLRKKCHDNVCRNELLVHQDDQLLIVKPDLLIEYRNYEYTVEQAAKICMQKNSFDVTRLGTGVTITSRKYNFAVMFTKEGDVKIGILNSQKGKVDGLCGYFDGIKSNDRQLPTGQLAVSTERFGRSWARPGLAPDACEARVAPGPKQTRIWELCDAIMEEPFSRCKSVLNLDKWRSICLEKVCACSDLVVNGTKRTEEQCLCLMLEQVEAECLAAAGGLDLAGWRMMKDCPTDCPAPLVYHNCYRKRCEPTCADLNSVSCPVEEGQCFPGCYCPEGKLRKGDTCVLPSDCLDCTCNGEGSAANYETFEGDKLPYLGNCTYLASRDRNETGHHKYEVYATNGPCEDKPIVTCVKSLYLIYEKNVIHITKDPKTKKLVTMIGDTAVFKYPVKKEWGTISLDKGQDVFISLPDIHLELTVFQAKLEFTVKVPSYLYSNQTEGLCGVCAGELELLLTSYGNQTGDFDEYGKSWQASGDALTTLRIPTEEQCDQAPPPEPCLPPPPASNPCYNLYNADKFGECHALVEPAPFIESCEADLCANITDICATLERYAAACRRQGVCLDKWRTDLCPYPCESPLVYRPCVACELTCENNDELKANPEKCDKQPVEGCFCPEGKVRVNNTCIEPQKCFPCDENKEHYAGDSWQESACTKCACSKVPGENKAHVSCSTQSCSTPVCAAGEQLVSEPPAPTACCPTYVCVPKPKSKECVEPKKMDCGFGQILKQKTTENGCPEFFCECKPPSECDPIPTRIMADMLEPGMERVIDNSSCCPKVEFVCRKDKCPRSPACPQFHDLTVRNVSDKCCPIYECELPKNKCLVKLEWESSPAGGESRRKIPEELFKEIDEMWSDGPCRSCECARSGGAPAAQCTGQACPPLPADPAFVLRARPVPFACCPDVDQVACRDGDHVYNVGQNWTSPDDVCTVNKCVDNNGVLEKIKTVQTCEKNCHPGWKYTPASPESKQCCGKCQPVACIVDGKEHPIGEKWTSTDFCANYTCVNVNGTLQVLSANETCPVISDALRKQFVFNDVKVPGQCCADQEPIACRVGNKIYQEGQTWPSSDPCRNVTCSRSAGGPLAHTAHVTACAASCRRGWVYRGPPPARCCGHCVQDACVIGPVLKQPGTTWQSPDNCTTYSCERAGDEVFVTSLRQACPDVSGCAPENIVKENCCTICKVTSANLSTCVAKEMPSRKTVELFRVKMGLRECVNKHPVSGFRECQGSCQSGVTFDAATGVHKTTCECCSAKKYAPIEVTLSCSDGTIQPHKVASPVECSCNVCGTGSDFWDINSAYTTKKPHYSGTKNVRPKPDKVKVEEDTDVIPEIFKRFGVDK